MTDVETFKGMLDRAGIPYHIEEIDTDQKHPVPGGTDITVQDKETIGGMTLVFSFDFDGDMNTLAGYNNGG